MIHRYWQGPPPAADYGPDLARLCRTEVRDWTPATLPAWLADLADAGAPHVVPERQAQHRANVARVGLLWLYGGMWADHDLQPHADLGRLPSPATAAHTDGSRCTCWLAYPAGHPHLAQLLAALAALGPPTASARCQSGELLWDRVVGVRVPAHVPLHHGWATHHAWTSALPRLGVPSRA